MVQFFYGKGISNLQHIQSVHEELEKWFAFDSNRSSSHNPKPPVITAKCMDFEIETAHTKTHTLVPLTMLGLFRFYSNFMEARRLRREHFLSSRLALFFLFDFSFILFNRVFAHSIHISKYR